MFLDQTCPKEITKLKLFPITLMDRAKAWLLSLKLGSIFTWFALHDAFLKKFFPNRLTTDLMRQIKTFSQKENEKFVQAWERSRTSSLHVYTMDSKSGGLSVSSMMGYHPK